MSRDVAPQPVIELAEARAAARRARDWTAADRLKGDIEAAGWKVIDSGTMYDLLRAAAPDVNVDGTDRYGSSATVPSRLDDAPVGTASVVLVATARPDDLARSLRGLVDHSPDGTQLVIVANAPSEGQAGTLTALDALDPGAPGVVTDVVWTSARLGHAAALNVGLRRTRAAVVVLLGPDVEVAGDLVTPLVAALEDPTVAVAGAFGLVSSDLGRFDAAEEAAADVEAIDGAVQAFRRADYAQRGPLDERFTTAPSLDVWWSLVLRDGYEDLSAESEDAPTHRRAVVVPGLPVRRGESGGEPGVVPADGDRLARRNHYRVLKRFATRRDLLVAPG
jgi:hypothetical protein